MLATDLMAARWQMAFSLGFHIVFAAIGMAMPFLMALAHFRWLRTGQEQYLRLTKAWSKGVAILFAVGAVSGTALSFELGLLWPTFMKHAGPIIGMPFSLEGAAFFLEAIALGVFLYGWNRVPRWVHWGSGLLVGISGVVSAFFIVCANGWMNTPAGFDWMNGAATNIDPWAAMFNRAALAQGIHMVIAAFQATAIAVAGLHAWGWMKNTRSAFHRSAFQIASAIAVIASLLQPLAGDFASRRVAANQPTKFAAMEALFSTQKGAPFLLGGVVDEQKEQVSYGVHVPKLLSLLTHHDPQAEIPGLDRVAKQDRPPVAVVHTSFQIMIGIGVLLAALSLATLLLRAWRRPIRWLLWGYVVCIPLGFLAIEAGWTVTEVGRQPWIIVGVMRTAEAVTPMPGLWYTFSLFVGLYVLLSVVVVVLIRRLFRQASAIDSKPAQNTLEVLP